MPDTTESNRSAAEPAATDTPEPNVLFPHVDRPHKLPAKKKSNQYDDHARIMIWCLHLVREEFGSTFTNDNDEYLDEVLTNRWICDNVQRPDGSFSKYPSVICNLLKTMEARGSPL